jgi:alpha-ribazole phosphatase
MSEMLFIRHAETDMAGTFCGHSDPQLNARGLAQLEELIDQLRAKQIGTVYTSDLRRALATGHAIADAFGVDCHARPALREIHFGRWEGLTWGEIEQQDEAYARRWAAEFPNLPAPDGESFRDFEQRTLEEVRFLSMLAGCDSRSVAIVTHAGALRTVLCAFHGCSEQEAWHLTRSYCCIISHNSVASSFSQTTGVRL